MTRPRRYASARVPAIGCDMAKRRRAVYGDPIGADRSGLELGNDLVRDFLIEARPVGTAARETRAVRAMGGSPRRAARSISIGPHPVTALAADFPSQMAGLKRHALSHEAGFQLSHVQSKSVPVLGLKGRCGAPAPAEVGWRDRLRARTQGGDILPPTSESLCHRYSRRGPTGVGGQHVDTNEKKRRSRLTALRRK